MTESKTYTVCQTYKPHNCGICGPSAMVTITVSDGEREKTMTQAICDNSDPLTPSGALEWFIEDAAC